MSLNHIIDNDYNETNGINIKVNNCNILNSLIVNNVPISGNIIKSSNSAIQSNDYLCKFDGINNEITNIPISGDNNGLILNSTYLKDASAVVLGTDINNDSKFYKSNIINEGVISAGGTDNLTFKINETQSNKNINMLSNTLITSRINSDVLNIENKKLYIDLDNSDNLNNDELLIRKTNDNINYNQLIKINNDGQILLNQNINNKPVITSSINPNISGINFDNNGYFKLVINNLDRITTSNIYTTIKNPLITTSIRSTENFLITNEMNIMAPRLLLYSKNTEDITFRQTDGTGAELISMVIKSNNYNPRIFINAQGTTAQPLISTYTDQTYGINFDDTTKAIKFSSNNTDKLNIGSTTSTYTNTQHNFFGPTTFYNGLIVGGVISAGYLTLTDNVFCRWGFHSNLSATTGYDLTNIITITLTTENTWVKIDSSMVSGTPQTLQQEIAGNGGFTPSTGTTTVNATGTYFITINISARKVSATGSRFICFGIGINGNQPTIAGRLICSLSSAVDDWNLYSASNIIQLSIFNTYAIWCMCIDLGGTASQNIYIGDISSSIFKCG